MVEYDFCKFAISQLVTLKKLHADANMLLGIFQKFSEQLFLRTTLTAAIIYKLPNFENVPAGNRIYQYW